MLYFLRQSTASQEIPIGPFLDDTDGKTQETALSIANTDIKIWKTGATSEVSKNSGGATHMANGRYYMTLDATDTNTLGQMEINVHVTGALPCKVCVCILSATIYDDLFSTGTSISSRLVNSVTHGGSAALLQLERVVVASTTAGEPAMKLTGNTSGAGLRISGGATGIGTWITGGSSSGNGLTIEATSGYGMYAGGGAAPGLALVGGTNSAGLSVAGNGTGAGFLATGGSTGAGVSVVGGGTSGNGINVTTTSGHGINLAPAGTNMHGVLTTGGNGGTSDGFKCAAGTGGVAFRGDITGNITGTLSTVTTLTNLPAITTDWLTATGLAASAVTEIQSGLASATDLATLASYVEIGRAHV